MILDILSTALAKKLVEVPLAPVLSSLQGLLLDGRALNFAKETLREKYTEAVLPSSYEHVVDNLQLTKEDFVEYFKATPTPTQSSLQKYLRARLLARSEGWINNRPAEMLLQSMVDDFLQAYQAYFVTTDPQLTTLNLTGLTQDALEVICEVRDAIKALSDAAARPSTEPRQGSDFGSEITTFLTVTNIPFEIVERDKSHADIVVIDPSSIFPTRFYLHATARPLSIDDLDQLLTRLRGHGRYSHVLVVAENVPFEVVSHGERRGVIFNSTAAFRQAFLKISTPERFIIGTLSARSLAETCNVHELYIHPDAVPVDPGDKLHQSWFSERVPVKQLIDAFLADQDQRILFVFGGYGSGND